MERQLTEAEIAKAYEGKPFIIEKVRKIATGTQDGAAVYSRRLVQKYGNAIGITDEIFERWWDEDIDVFISMVFDDDTQTIKECKFIKKRITKVGDKKYKHDILTPTQEDLEIFRNALEFITTE
jgi:hypothetical protein